jgi:hypothetical protein
MDTFAGSPQAYEKLPNPVIVVESELGGSLTQPSPPLQGSMQVERTGVQWKKMFEDNAIKKAPRLHLARIMSCSSQQSDMNNS